MKDNHFFTFNLLTWKSLKYHFLSSQAERIFSFQNKKRHCNLSHWIFQDENCPNFVNQNLLTSSNFVNNLILTITTIVIVWKIDNFMKQLWWRVPDKNVKQLSNKNEVFPWTCSWKFFIKWSNFIHFSLEMLTITQQLTNCFFWKLAKTWG